jgi:hypothetical protein
MSLKTIGFARLDSMLAEDGYDFLAGVVTRVGGGELPSEVARSFGMPWVVLKAWLEDDPDRMALMELALRAGADELEAQALKEVRDADSETVQLAKLRYESYVRSAGFRDRKKYGNKVDVEVVHNVSIVEALREARGRVVEHVEPMRLPVTINQTEVVEI